MMKDLTACVRTGISVPFLALALVLMFLAAGLDILGHVIAGTWDWEARQPKE